MQNINDYMMALLSTEGKFSYHKSAEKLENISHDKLTRFLKSIKYKCSRQKNLFN